MRKPILVARLACLAIAVCAAVPAATAQHHDSTEPVSQLARDVEMLAADDMAGRGMGTEGSERARKYIVARLVEIGLTPVGDSFARPFEAVLDPRLAKALGVDRLTGANLVAMIKGRANSDRVMIVSAHYDHLGVRDGEIYNGADDNASGVAALLAIAQSFKASPPLHDTLFVLFDGEELGLLGARAFLADPPVKADRIALDINLDMVSRSDKDELYAVGAVHFPRLRARLDALAAKAPVTLLQGHEGPPWEGSDDWTGGSDHRIFLDAGIPFVYFGVEDHPDYHRPSDDFEQIPLDFFARSAATTLMAARMFDDDLDAIAAEIDVPRN